MNNNQYMFTRKKKINHFVFSFYLKHIRFSCHFLYFCKIIIELKY